MKKITILIAALTLSFNAVNAQTNFGWETAVVSADNVETTETIDGILLTFSNNFPDSNASNVSIFNYDGYYGVTGNAGICNGTTSVTFTFNQPVDVTSIVTAAFVDGNITFTPTGGSNSPVVVAAMADGSVSDTPVNLNWTNVLSFTVTSPSATDFLFDNLLVMALSECPVPSAIVISNIDSSSAEVSWTAGGTETEWEVVYGVPGFDPETEGISIADNDGTLGETLEDLTADTTYDVYVRAICADSTQSNWSAVESFTTEELSVNSVNFQNFSYHPNPVKANLSLKAGLQIEKVSIYNILGQEVISLNPTSLNTEIDLSRLQTGLYMLVVSIHGEIKTFKVIKE